MNYKEFCAGALAVILFLDAFFCPMFYVYRSLLFDNKDKTAEERIDNTFEFLNPVILTAISFFFIHFFYRSALYGLACGINSPVIFFASICPANLCHRLFFKKYKYGWIAGLLIYIALIYLTIKFSDPFLSKRCPFSLD